MRSSILLIMTSIQLGGCLPWVDGLFEFSGDGGGAESLSNSGPMDPTGGAGPGGDETTTPATGAGTMPADATTSVEMTTSAETSASATDTGDSGGAPMCSTAEQSTPALAFAMIGEDLPAIAVGTDCQTYMAGERGDWGACPSSSARVGTAYLARLAEDGSCQHIIELPGQRASDVAMLGDGAVIVAGEAIDGQPALLARVNPDNEVQLSDYAGPGAHARALAVTPDHVFVAGACEKIGDDTLWVARFDHALDQVVETDCKNTTLLEGRAIAATSDKVFVVGKMADTTAYIASYDQALAPPAVVELVGVEPDFGTQTGHGAGIVASTHGVYVAIGCEGDEFGPAGKIVACDDPDNLQGANIALVHLDNAGTPVGTLVVGGIGEQHVTALALADADTLVMTGSFDGSISLTQELSASEALGATYSFIAWFDITGGAPVAKDLWFVDHDNGGGSMAFDIAVNVGAPADALRMVIAGAATDTACLRPYSEACTSLPVAAGGQNFLASLPLAP